MSTRVLPLLAALVLGVVVTRAAADPTVPAGYVVERYATGLGAAAALALGPDGALYITDYANGRLLRRTPSGTVELVASGLTYSNALAVLPSGRIFAGANTSNVYEIIGGVPQLFASGFSYISSMAVRGDDLYVSGEHGIARISSSTGAVTTVLGDVVNPFGLSFDAAGNLYFISHGPGELYTYNFVDPVRHLAHITPFGGTYTGIGFGSRLLWGDYQRGTLFTLNDAGAVAAFATGFIGANPPANGPNGIVAQGADVIFVADGPHVWRIARVPPALTGLTLRQSSVAGCKAVIGTVTLSSAAPAGGLLVTLSDTLAAASTPVSVRIPEGASTKTFTVKTIPVATGQSGEITATLGGTTLRRDFTVRPIGISSVTLTPIAVVGSNPAAGLAKLECTAAPGPVTVDLASSNAAIASPVAASIVVPQGLQWATFDVTTNPVLSQAYATISATANGITKSKSLTVKVAASVSPTALRFGNITVGTTSGVLSATLSNRGAVPYSITSISLTGTSARYFVQTNDCPATLAAGATCRVDVTFAPTVAGSKLAYLKIGTSAKSSALSVALSGTGVAGP